MKNALWLLGFARSATWALLGSILSRLLTTAATAAMLAIPAWAIGTITMRHVHGEPVGAGFVLAVVAGFALISVIKAITRYTEQLLGHVAAFRLLAELRIWIIDRLIPQAPAVTDGIGVARLQTVAVRDVDRIEVFFAHTIAPAITAIVIPVAATATAWVMAGWQVALALAAVLLVGLVIPAIGARASATAAWEQAEARADISQHVADTVRLREDVWANEAENVRMQHLDAYGERVGELLAASGRRTAWRHALSQLRVWGGTVFVLAVGLGTAIPAGGSLMSADGSVNALPGILVAAAFVPGTIAVLETVERSATSLPAGLEATRRIRELAAGAPAVSEPAEPAQPRPEELASANLTEVDFAYPGRDAPVLDAVTIQVPAGAFIGVVGATGSGKSTVARLLQRHVDPGSGTVHVAGVDARELGSVQVSELVAVADQEPFIASGTVAENLRLADPDASDKTLAWAAQLACLDLPWERRLRHRGESLSGGQRQRLALARTLVRARATASKHAQASGTENRPETLQAILVLDEATSHQDALTQQKIVRNIRQLGASVVMIAHRLHTLREADCIYVLEAGRVVESGAWEDLIRRDGAFLALLNVNT